MSSFSIVAYLRTSPFSFTLPAKIRELSELLQILLPAFTKDTRNEVPAEGASSPPSVKWNSKGCSGELLFINYNRTEEFILSLLFNRTEEFKFNNFYCLSLSTFKYNSAKRADDPLNPCNIHYPFRPH